VSSEEDEDGGKWWQFILYGLGTLGFAIFMYVYLTNKEHEGGRVRMQWMIALVYEFLGKWGVAGVLVVLSAIFLLFGIWQYGKPRRASG
jgi:hypothetical protein